MPTTSATQFVSEAIEPVSGSMDAASMARGEPGVPGEFVWRGRTHQVRRVLRRWKESGPCRHGSGEMYLRKHWYELETADGQRMQIYFERQRRPGGKVSARWWLYGVQSPHA